MKYIIKFLCSWRLSLVIVFLLVSSYLSYAYQNVLIYLLADQVAVKEYLLIGDNSIKTLNSKIYFEDYFDDSDSLNIAGLITKDYCCIFSGINWYSGGSFQEYLDSLNVVKDAKESKMEYSHHVYEVGIDTMYYYEEKSSFIKAKLFCPNRSLYIQVQYLTESSIKIRELINKMLYYNHENIYWKILD